MREALTSFRSSRGAVWAFVSFVFTALVAYEVAQFVLAEDINYLLYFGLFLAGAIGAVTVLNNWRKGVYLFIAWILFEDIVRKSILDQVLTLGGSAKQ